MQKNWLGVTRCLLALMIYLAIAGNANSSCYAQPFFVDYWTRQALSLQVGIKLIATHDILKELDDIEGWEGWEGSGSEKNQRLTKEVDDLRREKIGLLVDAHAGASYCVSSARGAAKSYSFSLLEHRQSSGNPYFVGDEPDPYLMIRYVRMQELRLTQIIDLQKNLSCVYSLRLLKGHLSFAQPIIWEKDVAKRVVLNQEGASTTSVTTRLGLDAGLEYKRGPWRLTVIGSNLNSPEFSYPQEAHLESYSIKPQLNIRAGFELSKEGRSLLTEELPPIALAVDCNLIPYETMLQGYKSMELACEAETRVLNDRLMLRAQMARNLAEDDIGWVYSLGLGTGVFGLQLHMDGALSSKTTKRSKTSRDCPVQIQTCLQISGQF